MEIKNLKSSILRLRSNRAGFTFIEAILYMGIVSIVMSSVIPFAWNIINSGVKSSYQEEVIANARYISERIKYEIRNSVGINSVSSSQIQLCRTVSPCSAASARTDITLSGTNVNISIAGAPAVNLNSNKVRVTSLTFTNNTLGLTKNISFTMTVTTSYTGARKEYIYTISNIRTSAEVRSN